MTQISWTDLYPYYTMRDPKLKDFMSFLVSEKRLFEKQHAAAMAMPLKERVERGIALDKLGLESCDDPTKMRITIHGFNNSKFRLGDHINLHRGDPTSPTESFDCKITDEDEDAYVIDFKNFAAQLARSNDRGWVIDQASSKVTFSIMHTVLRDIEQYYRKDLMVDLLRGQIARNVDTKHYSEIEATDFDVIPCSNPISRLDQSQRKAFLNAVTCDRLHLVQGPPGTGKTFMIAFLCGYLASQGKRVLVTGFTHRAINNAMRAIAALYPTLDGLVKCGDPFDALELKDIGNIERVLAYKDSRWYNRFDIGKVIGATPYKLANKDFGTNIFDYVIFDEASQLTANLALMGMYRGDKCIFFGDHKQLGPIIQGSVADDPIYEQQLFNSSVFAALFKHYGGDTLTTCYRMHPDLIAFSSRTFYDAEVQAAAMNATKKLHLHRTPLMHAEIVNPEQREVVVKLSHKDKNFQSKPEAVLIAELVHELVRCGVDKQEIGIIAPYRPQLNVIKKEIRQLGLSTDGLIIETVERMQGQERDVIILSMTRSNLGEDVSGLAFFFDPNRLNVAITRARKKRIVVCSDELFKAGKLKESLDAQVKVLHDFLNGSPHVVELK